MRNLLIFHLESVAIQRFAAFAHAFPNVRRMFAEALVFDRFFASATSTVMVISYLFYGNDFEFDPSSRFEGMLPEGNNPHLFNLLQQRGYRSNLICLNGFKHQRPIRMRPWTKDLPPVFDTNDFPTLFAKFDELTDGAQNAPFAIYVWDLISHVEHSLALAPQANGLTDQVMRACRVADDAVGEMRAILERKGLLDDTTIVLYGDHGDDYWSHGYKGGMIHGTEPYTSVIRTPLAIRDARIAPGVVDRLASTIDLSPTCLALLGIDAPLPFAHSGADLMQRTPAIVYSQNFTANQPDDRERGIAQAFAAIDDTYALIASSRGLELYAYQLDDGNHCNLLHLLERDAAGRMTLPLRPDAAGHFRAALQENPRAVEHLTQGYARLREALAARVEAKRAYIASRGVEPRHALPRACFDTTNPQGRDAFFGTAGHAPPLKVPVFDFEYRLR